MLVLAALEARGSAAGTCGMSASPKRTVSRDCLIIVTDAISVHRTGEDIGNYIGGSHNRCREMRKGIEPWDPLR